VGVTFTVFDDNVEGALGAGFAASSDDLGDDTDDELTLASRDNPNGSEIYEASEPYAYSSSVTLRGPIEKESEAKAVLEGKVRCEEDSPYAFARLASTGSTTYSVGVPTYEPGQAPGSEDGY